MADDKTFTKAELDAAVEAAVSKATGDVEGLKDKVQELIGDNKKLKNELRKTQDIKPEDVAALEHQVEELTGKLTVAEKAAKDATTAKEKAEKALEAEQGFTNKLLISDGLKSALLENGVKDEDFIDSLSAKFGGQAKVVLEGEERKAMIGDKPLGDFVKEWAGTDAGKKFVAAPANSGGGASGGSGGGGSQKTMPRAEFEALPQAERMAFSKDGGKVVDATA